MNHIAIIGCGLIGRGWAIVFARSGYNVKLFDTHSQTLDRALTHIGESMTKLNELGLLNGDPQELCNNIACTENLETAVINADYVQENITEDVELKKQFYKKLDQITKPECILASSTSSITTSVFSFELKGRNRCIVAHPVNPPHLIPLVEISPAPFTDESVIKRTIDLQKSVKQKPILIKKEIPGFVLNRLQAAVLLESWQLVKEGYVSVEDLDKTIKDGLGHRWAFMGPFETIDLNARNGIAEYADTFGETYRKMMQNDRYSFWDDVLIKKITASRRDIISKTDLGNREKWRDTLLAELLVHKISSVKKHGE